MKKTAFPGTDKGFTLVEMITVMVITGIIAMIVVNMITTPMESYNDLKRRAELVDIAELTLHRMARDIHRALPNSVRISNSNQTIEVLHTIAGGRYKAASFDATQATTVMDLEKAIDAASDVDTTSDTTSCGYSGKVDCLVVYNLGSGQPNADAWLGSGFDGANVTPVHSLSATQISYAANRFYYDSPQKRFMIIDRAIAFVCSGEQLYLSENYNFVSASPTNQYLLADNISSCHFDYNPGTSTRPGLVTMRLGISDAGETISLLQQVFVENQP